MARVFLTGASGFLGYHTRTALEHRGHTVLSLTRTATDLPGAIVGDLAAPETYRKALAGVDVVVHLAAVTGKAAPEEYMRVNGSGTRVLLEATRAARVPRFLFVSSIAVTFPDIARYPYAQSKMEAERLVRESGLRTVTVRPTIIAGGGSPVMAKLGALARLPIVPLFGGGGTRVQPILAIDLAEFLADLIDQDRFSDEVLELGGRDVVTVRELLARLAAQSGRAPARFLPVPMPVILAPVAVLETFLGARLPLTVGQLATFRFDGVARTNTLFESRRDRLASLDQLLTDSSRFTAEADAGPATTDVLGRECRTFARAITGREASQYIVSKYVDAHRVRPDLAPPEGFDATLVVWARSSPLVTRMADAYSRRVMPRGALRKKLILLLSVIETSPELHRSVELSAPMATMSVAVRLAGAGLAGLAALAAGFLLFGTLRIVSRSNR